MHPMRAASLVLLLPVLWACGALITPTGFDSFTAPLGYDSADLTRRLRVAAVSMASSRDDKAANLASLERLVDTVLAEHADTDVVVFPELCTSWLYVEENPEPYYRSVAETIPGPSTETVRALAMDRDVAIVFGLAEVDGDRYYNSQAMLLSDGTLVRYRKRGLNSGDIANGCTPGEGPVTASIRGVEVTFAICSDYQDEATIRDLSLSDAGVVLASLVTSTVLNPDVDFFARSVGKWVVYSNGAGSNSGLEMPGRVFIADPTGTVHDAHTGAGSYAWLSLGVAE